MVTNGIGVIGIMAGKEDSLYSIAGGKIDGVCNIAGGFYKELHINGVCNIEGDVETESFHIDGVCNCSGSITAEEFDCDGVLTISGNLRAGKADIDGVVTVNGDKVGADRITCDGVLSVDGEISSDVIVAKGKLVAREVVGDEITIKSYWKTSGLAGALVKLVSNVSFGYSSVDLIEGTTVDLRGVRAKSVSGQNVMIGKNCEIDRVEASGTLEIHPDARVGEIAK